MIPKARWFGWLLAAALAGFLVRGFSAVEPGRPPSAAEAAVPSVEVAANDGDRGDVFLDTRLFLAGADAFWRGSPGAADCPSTMDPKPVLLLPHYLPAAQDIRRAIGAWRACRGADPPVTRVFAIGPDHYHRLATGAATYAGGGFITPLGRVATDRESVLALRAAGVKEDRELFAREHGVGLFPVFVREAFPGATYVPVVISANATQKELRPLADFLRVALAEPGTILVVSSDFSHYRTRDEAERRDRETLRALALGDAAFFWGAGDAYLDFGRGVWLALQLVGPDAPFIAFGRFNSADRGGPRDVTTSFMSGWWRSR